MLLIAGSVLASQAMAEQASSDLRTLQSGRIDGGDSHTCAIYTGGNVRCWGLGTSGRLGYGNVNSIGDNEAPSTAGPVNLGAGRTAVALAAGSEHTCALLDDATVRCWGEGDDGRLGYANINDIGDNEAPGSVGPVNLGAGRTAVAITAAGAHTCAVLDDATVRCWGDGTYGQPGYGNVNDIGDNETPGSVGPVNLGAGRTAVAIAAGLAHNCAVLDDATVRCWGYGGLGALGYGNTNDIGDNEAPGSVGPVNLGAGRTAVAITGGGVHTCAVLDNATVRCWGYGANGRLGYGNVNTIGDDETPGSVGTVNLGAGRTAVAIAGGGQHTCAVLDNDTVRCWGEADFGRLGYGNLNDIGDNETPDAAGPVNLGAGRTAVTITAGYFHTCAVLDNGTVSCWGEADFGRLGYGNLNDIGDNETPDSAGPVSLGGTVDVEGYPPVAVNDSATVAEDAGAAAISVLANDTDVDGGTKVIASASDPANGTVVLTGGSPGAHTGLTYQPDANYCNDGAPPDDTFTYTLNGGSTATVSVAVTCVDDSPVAVNDSATMAEDASPTSIDVLANDTDIDAGPKTISSASDPANGTVVLTGGSAGAHTGLTYEPDPNYCNDGAPPDDTFTYTLNGGSQATVSVAVSCVEDAPVAVNDSASVAEDASATSISVLANDTDVDGGPKTISSASDPANGTVVLTGGSPGAHTGLTYQPDPNYCNGGSPTDNFTYTLNGGSTATVSMTVTCVDDSPVAVNDSASVAEDASATSINVLINDTDIDGGPKTVQSTSDPANGTVVITGGGSGLTYQPDANYCNDGPLPDDTFSYTLNGGSQATVSVAVTCVEDDPAAVNDSATVAEDASATAIDVLVNDTDPDGGTKTISSASDPANGTVVLTGGSPGAHTGLTYQPDPNYCNDGAPPDDTFNYTLNGGSQATVSVAVSCVDDLPVAVNDSDTVTRDSGATAITVLLNDTDIDGGPKQIQSTTDPANGSVVVTGGGSGLTYQPDPSYCNDGSQTDNFTYTLNGGSTATVSMTVTCVDLPPVAVPDTAAVEEDSGASAIDVLANDTDVDGGPMQVQSTTDPANGSVVVTGGGSGLTYQPDPEYCNDGVPPDDTFTYTLNGGSTATVSVAVTCVEEAGTPPTQPPATPQAEQHLDVHRVMVPNSITKLLRKGIKVQASCVLDCRVVLTVGVSRAVANSMGLRRNVLARGSGLADAGERYWVTARLTRAARQALLTYSGSGRLQINVKAVDPEETYRATISCASAAGAPVLAPCPTSSAAQGTSPAETEAAPKAKPLLLPER